MRLFFSLFCIFLVVGLTPAYAVEMNETQKDTEYLQYYMQQSKFYKFTHAMKALKASSRLAEGLFPYKIPDKDEIKKWLENQKTELKKLKEEEKEEKSLDKEFGGYYNQKRVILPVGEVNGTVNNTSTTDLNLTLVNPPKKAYKDANKTIELFEGMSISQLSNLNELKNDTIVQLATKVDKHFYLKYWVYKGLIQKENGKLYVKLYNGVEYVEYSLETFQKAFTSLTLQPKNDEVSLEELTNQIYNNKIQTLTQKIIKCEQKIVSLTKLAIIELIIAVVSLIGIILGGLYLGPLSILMNFIVLFTVVITSFIFLINLATLTISVGLLFFYTYSHIDAKRELKSLRERKI